MKKLLLILSVLFIGQSSAAEDVNETSQKLQAVNGDPVEFPFEVWQQLLTVKDMVDALGDDPNDEIIPLHNIAEEETLHDILALVQDQTISDSNSLDKNVKLFLVLNILNYQDPLFYVLRRKVALGMLTTDYINDSNGARLYTVFGTYGNKFDAMLTDIYIEWLNQNQDAEILLGKRKALPLIRQMGLKLSNNLVSGKAELGKALKNVLENPDLENTFIHIVDDQLPFIINFQTRNKPGTIEELIKKGILPNYTHGVLDLTNRKLYSTYGLSSLQNKNSIRSLYLTNNQLTQLSVGAFNDLESLQLLYLNKNQLTQPPVGAFNGLVRLKHLSLANNQFIELLVGVFDGLVQLQSLGLNDNQLTKLPVGVFNGLGSLKSLNVENNQLTELPAGVFDGLAQLQYLFLKNNRFNPSITQWHHLQLIKQEHPEWFALPQ